MRPLRESLPLQKIRRPAFRLYREHRELLAELDRFYAALVRLRGEGKLHFGRNVASLKVSADRIGRLAAVHMALEEGAFFPFLKKHIPRLGPVISFVSAEHDEFRRELRSFKRVLSALRVSGPSADVREAFAKGAFLTCLLRSHFAIESRNLYSAADGELRAEEKKALLERLRI